MDGVVLDILKHWITRAKQREEPNKYANIMIRVVGNDTMQNGEYYLVYEVKMKVTD